jgi:lipid-binding SYLF domain-containing protein
MAQDPNTAQKVQDKLESVASQTKDACNEIGQKVKEQTTSNDQSKEQKADQDNNPSIASKVKGALSSVGQQVTEFGDKIKDATTTRLSMPGLLKAARESSEKFLSPKLDIEKKIPRQLVRETKGIVFLCSLKAAMMIGGSVGAGIMIAKLDNGSWSAPCAIGLLGGQWGLNIGAQKTDFVIILRDKKAVDLFSGKGQIKFGADASIAAGPIGRDAQLAVGANDKGYAATVSYSMAQGMYAGFALEGQGIAVRNDCNEKFYGKKVEAKDILGASGDALEFINDDFTKICELFDNYNDSQKIKIIFMYFCIFTVYFYNIIFN